MSRRIFYTQPKIPDEEWLAMRTGQVKAEVMKRDGPKCHFCGCRTHDLPDGNPPQRQSMDHVVPRYYGGPYTPDNLVNACTFCNGKKGIKLDPDHCDFCRAAFKKYPPEEKPAPYLNPRYIRKQDR